MNLILTRHGETEDNIKGIMQGHLPGKLTKTGIQQAEKLALRLKNEKIDAIYSSDLARAADTAKIIAKYHPDIPLMFVKELREADLGSFTGKNSKKVDWDNRPEDVETYESMRVRIKKLLESVYEKYPNKTVLFVGHNGINMVLLSVITKKKREDLEIKRLSNTSVSIFEIKENNNHEIHLLNCTDHL